LSDKRFSRIAWGTGRTGGVIAGGLENGQIALWDAHSIINEQDTQQSKALIFERTAHKGAVRGVSLNTLQPNTLATGAIDGEVLDTTLLIIQGTAFNIIIKQKIYIWDLNQLDKEPTTASRSTRVESIMHLAWNTGTPYILSVASSSGVDVIYDMRSSKEITSLSYPGGRKAMVCSTWSPQDSLIIATAADDDYDPCVLVWDLRNVSAPVSMFRGHSKAITSIAWNQRDYGLLASCSKDTRTCIWNTKTSTLIGDLHVSDDWAGEVGWCDQNPELALVSSYDGKVSVHSLLGNAATEDSRIASPKSVAPDDAFSLAVMRGNANKMNTLHPPFKLETPPAWFKRPNSVSWGFGGRLVTVTNQTIPGSDYSQSSVMARTISTDEKLRERIESIRQVVAYSSPEVLADYCQLKAHSDPTEEQTWKFLQLLLSPTKQAITDFLGVQDKNEKNVELLKMLSITDTPVSPSNVPTLVGIAPDSLISTAMLEDVVIQCPPVLVSPLKLHSSSSDDKQESDVDIAITRYVVVGDFESAVKLCLATDRLADALAFAIQGSQDLLSQTQAEYFKRTAPKKSYARLLQGITYNQVAATIATVDIEEGDAGSWKGAMAYLYTFAKDKDITEALSVLGKKYDDALLKKTANDTALIKEKRNNQSLASLYCHLGAGNVARVVDIWKMKTGFHTPTNLSLYHQSLQTFVEKIIIYTFAIGFIDHDLFTDETLPTYPLEPLYEAYSEYIHLLANNGALDLSYELTKLIPVHYVSKKPTLELLPAVQRNRLTYSGSVQGDVNYPAVLPYEVRDVVDIDLINENKRIALELANRQAQQAQLLAQQQAQRSQQSQQFSQCKDLYVDG